MATTNLFSDPLFKDGIFASSDSKARAYALQKAVNAIDWGHGIRIMFSRGEGSETDFEQE